MIIPGGHAWAHSPEECQLHNRRAPVRRALAKNKTLQAIRPCCGDVWQSSTDYGNSNFQLNSAKEITIGYGLAIV